MGWRFSGRDRTIVATEATPGGVGRMCESSPCPRCCRMACRAVIVTRNMVRWLTASRLAIVARTTRTDDHVMVHLRDLEPGVGRVAGFTSVTGLNVAGALGFCRRGDGCAGMAGDAAARRTLEYSARMTSATFRFFVRASQGKTRR